MKIEDFLDGLDKHIKTSRFLNGLLGLVTLFIVFFFWIAVCAKEAGTIGMELGNREKLILFGDSFVPSVITYSLGIQVQNIILLGEKQYKHASAIIIVLIIVLVQIAAYLSLRNKAIYNEEWLIVFLVCGVLPVILGFVTIFSCNKNDISSKKGLSG